MCGSEEEEEEETGDVSVLLFGPRGEEPVVDSTLRREGAALRGKISFLRNRQRCVFHLQTLKTRI